MIRFKVCSEMSVVSTEGGSQVDTLDAMIRSVLDASSGLPLTEIRLGACYEHVPEGLGWQRVTFLVGKGAGGGLVTLGICDVKPETDGKLIYMKEIQAIDCHL